MEHDNLSDAIAYIQALHAENKRLRTALTLSVNLQSHYASLLNMHDGGKRIEFADADAWLKRLDTHGQGAATPSEK